MLPQKTWVPMGLFTTTLRAYERYFSGASLDFVEDDGPFKTPYLPCSRCATCLVAFYLHLVNFNGTGAGKYTSPMDPMGLIKNHLTRDNIPVHLVHLG